MTTAVTVPSSEALEAECNELGMELLNVLEYIGDTIDYRKITLLIQKLSNSMDFIVNGAGKLKNIQFSNADLETNLQEKKGQLLRLQEELVRYTQISNE